MHPRRCGLLLILALVALGLLASPVSSWAHSGTEWLSDEIVTPKADTPTSESSSLFTLRAAPPSPGLSWPVLLGAFILVAIGRPRARRALAILPAPAVATEIVQPDPVALFPSPVQGRAPPIVAA